MRHAAIHRLSSAVAACLVGTPFLADSCRANVGEDERTGFAVFIDNEFLALDSWTQVNDDRNYTGGLAFAWGGRRFAQAWLGAPRNAVDGLLRSHDEDPSASYHAVIAGVTVFTPNDLEEPNPIPTDRPYAALTFLANQKTSAVRGSDTKARRSMLVVGVLGLDIAKGAQRYLHNQLGVSSQDPLGWDNQISEGGELTALYSAERLKRVDRRDSFDLAANYGYKVGYYTGLTAGFDLRLGRRASAFYEHSPNPMANYSANLRSALPRNDLYAFVSYQATLVGFNALLQGQVRKSAQTFSGSQIERLVHWAGIGVVAGYDEWKLTYTFQYRSPEFKGPEAREHYWPGVYVTCQY